MAAVPGGGPGRRTIALRDGSRFALVDPGGTTASSGACAGAERPGYDDSASTSGHPGADDGALGISRLEVPAA
ncbi:hypothetical protein [Streptomyces sp. NPDC099088]|uniref:hypothetical protein n=1 Tax=Streptomyces sp. NPDC099088 TaxID=3366101 RepID=UPI0038276CD5